jgi:hypothetical protein
MAPVASPPPLAAAPAAPAPWHTGTPSKSSRGQSPPPPFELILLFLTRGPDAVGWSGAPPHTAGDLKTCIDPAPFGAQCTMHASDAVRACISLPSCAALTCPAPEPYLNEDGRRGITGAVCQARSVPSAAAWLGGADAEPGHGMCAPSGCTSAFLVPVPSRAMRAAAVAALEAAGALAALRARGAAGARLVAVDATAGAHAGLLGLGSPVAQLDGGRCCSATSGDGAWLLRDGADVAMREKLAPQGAPPWARLPKSLAVHVV